MAMIFSPHFIVKRLQLNILKRYAGYIRGKILDVGCGVRPYKRYLVGSIKYIGMDELEQFRPDILARAQEIPFSDEKFDSVLCTETLEHLPEPQKAIEQIKRVLKKDGYLYISVPQTWSLHYEPYDYFRFTKYGLKYLLEKNEFKVLAIERIGGIFSLVGQRIIDVVYRAITNCLMVICGIKYAQRISSILCLPISLGFYLLAKVYDGINKEDALCWAVLAKKE